MIYEIVGIIGALFELLGVYLLGHKNKNGFLFNILGSSIWILFSLLTHSAYGLIIVCVAAGILNMKGYLNWKNKQQ